MYIRKHFRPNSESVIQEMVNRIRAELKLILSEVDWIDKATRQSALKKLDLMSFHIGFPDTFMTNSNIDKYYEKLHIDETSYFSFILSINRFISERDMGALRDRVNNKFWETAQPQYEVNAGYILEGNNIRKCWFVVQKIWNTLIESLFCRYSSCCSTRSSFLR